MFRLIRKRWKLLLFLLVIISLSGFFIKKKVTPKPEYKSSTSTKVKQGKLKQVLTISGEIDASEKANLRFQTSGRLVWVGVKEGDSVKKYQLIASLDKRELEKTLKKKLLAFMNERWDFEQLHDDNLVFGRDINKMGELTVEERRILEQAQFDLDTTVLDVEIQDLAVKFANLTTPIDGIVTSVNTPFAGVNITPAGAEFVVINPESIYFSALADETEVTELKEGLTGELILDAFSDQTFQGTVNNISFIPKPGESGTVYEIKFYFMPLDPNNRIRLGMVGDLSFVTNEKDNVLYLPAKYILTENGNKFVFIKHDKGIDKVNVKTGMEAGDNIEITEKLKKGDTVYLPE